MIDNKIKVDKKKGLLQSAMLRKWRELLYILHKFLTYEGRYTLSFVYHIRLLLHFESRKLINFPYYLLLSLEKMVKGVQSGDTIQVAYKLYHHGLITILIKKVLEEKGVTWKAFLKEFWARSAGKSANTSANKKRKVDTPSSTKKKGKITPCKHKRSLSKTFHPR